MGSKASANLIGYSTAIIQAILYSTMGIFGKLLYATGLDSSQAMILRMGFTVVYLGALLLIWRKHRLFSRHKETYIQSAFFFLSAWIYLLAVQHMNAGLVTCIFYTFPAVVALLNTIIFKEKMTWRVVMALALSIIGIILISGILELMGALIDEHTPALSRPRRPPAARFVIMLRSIPIRDNPRHELRGELVYLDVHDVDGLPGGIARSVCPGGSRRLHGI